MDFYFSYTYLESSSFAEMLEDIFSSGWQNGSGSKACSSFQWLWYWRVGLLWISCTSSDSVGHHCSRPRPAHNFGFFVRHNKRVLVRSRNLNRFVNHFFTHLRNLVILQITNMFPYPSVPYLSDFMISCWTGICQRAPKWPSCVNLWKSRKVLKNNDSGVTRDSGGE